MAELHQSFEASQFQNQTGPPHKYEEEDEDGRKSRTEFQFGAFQSSEESRFETLAVPSSSSSSLLEFTETDHYRFEVGSEMQTIDGAQFQDDVPAGTDQSKVTESHASSPIKSGAVPHAADTKSAVGATTFTLRSEKPTEPPPRAGKAFAQSATAEAEVGNVEFIAELRDEGKLGLFFSRERARGQPVTIPIRVNAYFEGIRKTLKDSMFHLLLNKSGLNNAEIASRIDDLSVTLACGCCLVTYMKLRALIFIELPNLYTSSYLRRPKDFTELPIPAPFAAAIQQLGAVNVTNLPTQKRYVPIFPENGHRFGIPEEYSWNPNQYAQAVDYARNIGLQFAVVNLKQKDGSAWWLLRQDYTEDVFELQLPLPESNFTSSMALFHTLWLDGESDNPSNVIFDLTELGPSCYGSILRDPHHGINVSTYEAVKERTTEIISLV